MTTGYSVFCYKYLFRLFLLLINHLNRHLKVSSKFEILMETLHKISSIDQKMSWIQKIALILEGFTK